MRFIVGSTVITILDTHSVGDTGRTGMVIDHDGHNSVLVKFADGIGWVDYIHGAGCWWCSPEELEILLEADDFSMEA